ncbi:MULTISPECIES: hypothetical protein [unclassified Streptomyces]|uniref:hypothetical protein n=1 Tax=unclassified Streptomyces TaxID=2593676 RepID=UPI0036F03970
MAGLDRGRLVGFVSLADITGSCPGSPHRPSTTSETTFVRDHELTVDQSAEAGGDNDRPTPVELFVTCRRPA